MHAAHNNPTNPTPLPPPEAPCCISRSKVSSGLAVVQALLTVSGLWLSVWLFLRETEHSEPDTECKLCISHWGLWMCPPASFWGGVAGACMIHGLTRNDSHSLSNAYELNVLLAPFSVAIFVLLACRSLNAPNELTCNQTAAGTYSCSESSITLALSLIMQAQAAACVCGALVVQAARRRIEERASVTIRRLKPGWRVHFTESGRPFYSHRKSGRVQWDPPDSPRSSRESLPSVAELEPAGC